MEILLPPSGVSHSYIICRSLKISAIRYTIKERLRMRRIKISKPLWSYGFERDVYDYNWNGVQFTITGFRQDVTIMELNKGANYDDGMLTVEEGLIPDAKAVIVVGLQSGTPVKIGDTVYKVVLGKLFEI